MGRVKEIRRYPVKSLQGECLERSRIGAQGLPGDRAWAVRDERRGGIRGAKKIPALMRLRARYPEPPEEGRVRAAEIETPEGERFLSTDDDASKRMSEAVRHEVTLWPLLSARETEHYRRGPPDHADLEQELRAIFGRAPDEPLPDLGRLPSELLEFESPPGTYFDAYPLLLLTEASLRSVAAAAPDSAVDVRRFRPNLLLEAEGTEERFPELAWRERRVRIGGCVLEVAVECPRCVMITHPQEELPRDPGLMRSVVRAAEGNLGVYARVAQPGEVALGDPVELL